MASVFETPITVFILAAETSHSGSVTPSFAKAVGVTDREERNRTNTAIRSAVESPPPYDYKLHLISDGGAPGAFNCALGLFIMTD